jgi:Na+/melibiose symporter-like transporter
MVCGHCGTDVKPGFYTCPSCGAVYRKVGGAGCLGQAFLILAILIIVLGIVPLAVGISDNSHGYLVFGLVLWAVAFGIAWMVYKSAKKRQSFQWVRRL